MYRSLKTYIHSHTSMPPSGSSSSHCFPRHSNVTAANGFGEPRHYVVNWTDDTRQPWKDPNLLLHREHTSASRLQCLVCPGAIGLSCFHSVLLWRQKGPAHPSAFLSVRCILTQCVPPVTPPLPHATAALSRQPMVGALWRQKISWCGDGTMLHELKVTSVIPYTDPFLFLLKHGRGLKIPTHQEPLALVYRFSRRSPEADSPRAHCLFCRQTEPSLHLTQLKTHCAEGPVLAISIYQGWTLREDTKSGACEVWRCHIANKHF